MKNELKKYVHQYANKISRIFFVISRIIFNLTPWEYRPHSKIRKLLEEEKFQKMFEILKDHIKKSMIFHRVNETRNYAIETALLNDKDKEYYYLEFGVWKGESANFFSNYVKKLYAFDSFEGLREEYTGTSATKGAFSLNKKIPKMNSNVEPVVGFIQETLDDFLKKHNPKINFVHLDMDTYPSTKYALEKLKPFLVKNSIIIFDEFYNYIGWEHGEYKALIETFNENEYEYKAFNLNDKEVVIQLK